MKIPHKTIERQLFARGYEHVIGVDEVGMGCLAGPVVVCAVAFSPAFYATAHRRLRRLRDSKLLSASQREAFAAALRTERGMVHAISVVYPREIDAINVFQAARVGMRRAIRRLGVPAAGAHVLVDGPHRIGSVAHEQTPVVHGDRTVFAIACASILAKAHRDAMMRQYARRFPGYGFEAHKGYGTQAHRARLSELGPTPLHRRSFRWAPPRP